MLALAAASPLWAQGTINAFGLPHRPIGNATLQWNPTLGELTIAGIGSSGMDGVEIDVMGSNGWHAFAHGAPLVVPVGGSYTVRAYHQPSSGPEVLVSETTVEGVAPQVRSVSMSFPGHATATVQGFLHGQLVYHESGQSVSGSSDLELLYYGEIDCTSYVKERDEEGRIHEYTDDVTESVIQGPDGTAARVDHVKVIPEGPSPGWPSIDRIRVTGRNLPPFKYQREAVAMSSVELTGRGQAMLATSSGSTEVSFLGGTMNDGVQVRSDHDRATMGRSMKYGARLDIADLDPSGTALPVGAQIQLSGTGVMQSPVEMEIGSATITKRGAGQLELAVDYSAVGSPTHRIEVVQNGAIIAAIPGHSGDVARFAAWPTGCSKELIWDSTGTSCFAMHWNRRIPIQVIGSSGGNYQADEIRVLAEGPGSLAEIRSLALFGRDLGTLRLLGAHEKRGADVTVFGRSCGGLPLTATAPNLGSIVTVTANGVAATAPLAIALLGPPLAAALPLDFLGMPGCELLVDPFDSITMPPIGGAATLSLAIPSMPALIGGELAVQVFAVAPGANPFGMLASNGTLLRFDR